MSWDNLQQLWGWPQWYHGHIPTLTSINRCYFTCLKMNNAPFPPQIYLFHNVTIIHPEEFTQCTTRGSFPSHWHETAYNMFTFSCLFLLPLVIMITCYTRIFCEISKRLKMHNCELESRLMLSGLIYTYWLSSAINKLLGVWINILGLPM